MSWSLNRRMHNACTDFRILHLKKVCGWFQTAGLMHKLESPNLHLSHGFPRMCFYNSLAAFCKYGISSPNDHGKNQIQIMCTDTVWIPISFASLRNSWSMKLCWKSIKYNFQENQGHWELGTHKGTSFPKQTLLCLGCQAPISQVASFLTSGVAYLVPH